MVICFQLLQFDRRIDMISWSSSKKGWGSLHCHLYLEIGVYPIPATKIRSSSLYTCCNIVSFMIDLSMHFTLAPYTFITTSCTFLYTLYTVVHWFTFQLFHPHVTPSFRHFVVITFHPSTHITHSFSILLLHSWVITSLIPTLHISPYHSITPPSLQTPTVGHPVATCRIPVETPAFPVESPADIL